MHATFGLLVGRCHNYCIASRNSFVHLLVDSIITYLLELGFVLFFFGLCRNPQTLSMLTLKIFPKAHMHFVKRTLSWTTFHWDWYVEEKRGWGGNEKQEIGNHLCKKKMLWIPFPYGLLDSNKPPTFAKIKQRDLKNTLVLMNTCWDVIVMCTKNNYEFALIPFQN